MLMFVDMGVRGFLLKRLLIMSKYGGVYKNVIYFTLKAGYIYYFQAIFLYVTNIRSKNLQNNGIYYAMRAKK